MTRRKVLYTLLFFAGLAVAESGRPQWANLPRLVKKSSTDDEADDASIQHTLWTYRTPKEVQKMKTTAFPVVRTSEESSIETVPCARAPLPTRPLKFWETMICGAISRSVAQTIMHPANTMKTILQSSRDRPSLIELARPQNFRRLTRGAGANFILSVPHGAVNFAVLELVRSKLNELNQRSPWSLPGPGLDFLSSALSTIACSVVSTPQMMITDNIMAGNYANLPAAIGGLANRGGIQGFYAGWWPGLVGKIPSYALTWTFFQQLKRVRDKLSNRPAKDIENSIMGCIASATTVCIMIPMDTIKTRLVTQAAGNLAAGTIPYKGIVDCAIRVAKEEGIGTFYRGLPPRLVSVVPMIGIQFGVYEAMKKVMLRRSVDIPKNQRRSRQPVAPVESYGREQVLEEAAMEVAASPEHPFPAPQFLRRVFDDRSKPSKTITKKLR